MWFFDVLALMELQLPNIPIESSLPAQALAAVRTPRLTKELVNSIRNLHRRFNHQTSPTLIAMAIRDMIWVHPPPEITAADVVAVFAKYPCLACRLAKLKRLPMALGSGITPGYIGERVSVDGIPVNTVSVDGYIGYFHFREQRSGFEYPYFYKAKTEFMDAVRSFKQYMALYGKRMKLLQFDAGSVEMSEESKHALLALGIQPCPAVPERQNQNFVERSVQTRCYAIAAMMLDQVTLGKSFWSWAVRTAMSAHNGTYVTDGAVALTHMTGYVPDLRKDFQFPFGTPVAIKDHQIDSFRFAPQGVYGIAICSTLNGNGGTWVYVPGRNREKPLVRFDIRDLGMYLQPVAELEREKAMDQVLADSGGVIAAVSGGPEDFMFPTLPEHQDSSLEHGGTQREQAELLEELNKTFDEQASVTPQQRTILEPVVTRSRSKLAEERIFRAVDTSESEDPVSILMCTMFAWAQDEGMDDNDLVESFDISKESLEQSFAYLAGSQEEPQQSPQEEKPVQPSLEHVLAVLKRKVRTDSNPTVTQAMKTEATRARWAIPIQKEYDQLVKLGVGYRVQRSDIPKGAKIVQSKIDLKEQRNPDGSFKKDKARMCAMDHLRELTTFVNTFAATGNETTLKILFQIAVTMKWLIFGVDFVGAFLHVALPLGMEVFMQLPPYFNENGLPVFWKLVKAMYGLRESPAIFTDDVRQKLSAAGWKCLISDRAVYIKINSHGDIGILYTHSDDERLFCSHKRVCEELVETLKKNYEITIGLNESFVGYRETRLRDGTIHLSMPAKIETLCSDLTEVAETPMAINFKEECVTDVSEPVSATQLSDFRSKLGLALFIVKVVPQVQPALQILAQQVNCLKVAALRAMKRVRMYMKGQQKRGLAFTPGPVCDKSAIKPVYQCDAAFDCFSGSRSNGAYMATIGDHDTAAVVAKTFVLPNVPTSSCEAEIVAGAAAVKDMIYVRGLLEEITFPQLEPTICHIDNLSMLQMSSEFAGRLKRVKHILRLLNFMVFHTKNGVVQWVHKGTKELTVDVLTKVHGPSTFTPFANILVGPDVSERAVESEEI